MAQSSETGSAIVVDDGEGGQATISVTNDTGAIHGQVLTDAGFGLAHARITVWGADKSASSNESGWFQVPDVPPGMRQVRAEHESYRPAESEVRVEAGRATRVTITLVPPAVGDAGERPHLHDYWAGRSEILVADRDFEYHRPFDSSPYAKAHSVFNKVYFAALGFACVNGGGKGLGTATSGFYFDDPAQTVYPGTGRIDITLSWTASDYVGGDAVSVVWHPANSTNWTWGPAIKSGATYSIPVEPAMTDAGHQAFTLWQFYLCTWAKDEPSTAGTYQAGKAFIGKFHAKVTIVRGEALDAEPAHPRFWQNGNSLRVLNATRTIRCEGDSTPCLNGAYGQGRFQVPQTFMLRPDALVPPGAATVLINVSWTYTPGASSPALGVSYSPASVAPHDKGSLSGFTKPHLVSQTATSRSYSVDAKPGETDSFYQGFSNWLVLWGQEGHEAEYEYQHTCACTLAVRLTMDAVRGGAG